MYSDVHLGRGVDMEVGHHAGAVVRVGSDSQAPEGIEEDEAGWVGRFGGARLESGDTFLQCEMNEGGSHRFERVHELVERPSV